MTAIQDYFRTALVIDDRLESDFRKPEPLQSEALPESLTEPTPDLVVPPEEDETPIYPAELVSAFLTQNIVCSVLELDPGADLVELALRGTRIADLVVLDWLLFGSHTATIGAINAIVEDNQGRLVVIVVFTGAHSLSDVATRLKDDAGFREIHDFVLRRDDIITLIFGKPGITLTDGEDIRTAAKYSALPKMIRDDLDLIFKGLMPKFAFRGINILRESVPKVLATFNSTLDAGALVHRALIPEPADAGSQYLDLLVSDFKQALIENRVNEVWDDQAVHDFLVNSSLLASPRELAELLRSTEGYSSTNRSQDDLAIAKEAVSLGLLKVGISTLNYKKVKTLAEAFSDDRQSDRALASLMCSTGIGSQCPRLELGMVVKDESGNYWLCIQPLCDSVRIIGSRAFPLMPLRESTEGDAPDAMFEDQAGQFVLVNFEQHPHKLVMPEFEPNGDGSVLAVGEAPDWRFEGRDASYEAITRLRPEIASQAVHGFTSMASRAGVNVSEWMRQGARP